MYRPLLVITGIRRIGKTSVMNVALNESKIPFAVLDCRKLKENSYHSFIRKRRELMIYMMRND